MGEFLVAAAIVVGLFVCAFVIPYLIVEGVPEWARLQRGKKKYRRELLEFIEWRRAKDMNQLNGLYGSESEWNDRNLAYLVRRYNERPKSYRREMLEERGETELMQWVLKNDPSVLKSRIQQLEKELGVNSE